MTAPVTLPTSPTTGSTTGGLPVRFAPDPALPHRDLLLDPAQVAGRLERLLPQWSLAGPVEECERLRGKYRLGESLRAVHRVRTGDRELLVSARMFRPGRAGREPAPGLVDEEIDTVFWLFPADRKLRTTGWLDTVPAGLRDVFGEPWVTSVVAAYAPERAVTARCLAASGAVLGYAKEFHAALPKDAGPDADPGAADGLRSQAILTAARDGLPAGSPLRLATPLGYRDGVSLYSALPGVPLSGVPLRPPVLAALGRALAALHARPVGALAEDGSGATGTRLNPGRIRRAAELVGQALPEHAAAAARVAELLLADLPAPAPRVHLHGDVHPANVLVQPDGVALIDLDQATAGPAAADLGPLLARLRHPAGVGPADPATRALAAAALLDGYGRDRPDDAELTWYGAAALLVERALRAVNCVRPEGLAELPDLLAAATTWLEER